MEPIKPCPFCGKPAKDNDGGNSVFGRMWWRVGCADCDVTFADREQWDNTKHLVLPPMECFERWNSRPIEDALRAEVAKLRSSIADHENDCACLPEDRSVTETVTALRAEVARLQAELAKYTGPLTYEQMRAASEQWETMIDDGTDYGNVRDWDAAISAAREGER